MNVVIGSEANPSQPLPPAPRRRWLTVLLLLVIFFSGSVLGGGGMFVFLRNRALHVLHHPEDGPARMANRLRSKLGLSAEQTRQVEEILRQRQLALQAIRREVQPRVVAELNEVERQIAAVLDDAQQEKWHAIFTRLCDTWIPDVPKEP